MLEIISITCRDKIRILEIMSITGRDKNTGDYNSYR